MLLRRVRSHGLRGLVSEYLVLQLLLLQQKAVRGRNAAHDLVHHPSLSPNPFPYLLPLLILRCGQLKLRLTFHEAAPQ